MIQELIEHKIRTSYELYKAAGLLDHGGEKGSLRELFLIDLIQSIIPHQFGIGSGIIVDKWKRQSKQHDIIVYDKRLIPPLLTEGRGGIFPVDSVLRVVEIKSTLTKNDVEQYIAQSWELNPNNPDGLKIASKGSLENGNTYYPFVLLFGYRSKINLIETMTQLMENKKVSSPHIFSMEKGVPMGDGNGGVVIRNMGLEENTKVFLLALLQSLEVSASSRARFSIADYLYGFNAKTSE